MLRKLLGAVCYALSALFPPLATVQERRLEKYIPKREPLNRLERHVLRIKHNDGKRHPNFRDRKAA